MQKRGGIMMYAYIRVSTARQDFSRQIDNIKKAYPEISLDNYVKEKYSAKTLDRPKWKALYKKLKSGDTVVFDSVSRMSRTAEEGIALYKVLYDKGVNLIFLNEPYCNTDTYKQSAEQSIQLTGNKIADIYIEATNQVLMILAETQIRQAFEQAEKERKDTSSRVSGGMRSKQLKAAEEGITIHYGLTKGDKLTTKKSLSAKEIILQYSKDFNGTLKDKDVCTLAGISRNTYYKYKAQLRAELDK
jgi:DNA invertase Pin-like site-specific DNA recombinase